VDSVSARYAGEMIEAMLLAPVLRPMIAGADMLGDYELDLLARSIAQNDDRGLGALIAAGWERVR
jgi:hypothetical protein